MIFCPPFHGGYHLPWKYKHTFLRKKKIVSPLNLSLDDTPCFYLISQVGKHVTTQMAKLIGEAVTRDPALNIQWFPAGRILWTPVDKTFCVNLHCLITVKASTAYLHYCQLLMRFSFPQDIMQAAESSTRIKMGIAISWEEKWQEILLEIMEPLYLVVYISLGHLHYVLWSTNPPMS